MKLLATLYQEWQKLVRDGHCRAENGWTFILSIYFDMTRAEKSLGRKATLAAVKTKWQKLLIDDLCRADNG